MVEKGMNESNEEFFDDEVDTIVLYLDDGSELDCYVLGLFEVEENKYQGNQYIALEVEESEDVLLYGYIEHEDGGFELRVIEDNDEFVAVSNEFDRLESLDIEE